MAERKSFSNDARNIIDGTVSAYRMDTIIRPKVRILPATPSIDLDFVFKPDISREELEDGISEIMQGQNLSHLAIALATEKIDSGSLWAWNTIVKPDGTRERVATNKKASEYWDEFGKRFNIDRTTIDNYIQAGRNYKKYRSLLDAVKFAERGNFTKLARLHRVMENVENGLVTIDEVRERLINGTLIQFSELYMRTPAPKISESPKPKAEPQLPVSVELEDRAIKVNDEPVILFNSAADPGLRASVKREVENVIRREAKGEVAVYTEIPSDLADIFRNIANRIKDILARDNYPVVLEAYDQTEAKVVERYAERFMADRRANNMKTPDKYK